MSGTNSNEMGFFFYFYGIVVFPLGFTDERRHIADEGCCSGKTEKEDGQKKVWKVPLMSKNGGIKKEKCEGGRKKEKGEIEWSLKEVMKSSTWLFRNKQRQYCSIRASKQNKNIWGEGRAKFSFFNLTNSPVPCVYIYIYTVKSWIIDFIPK